VGGVGADLKLYDRTHVLESGEEIWSKQFPTVHVTAVFYVAKNAWWKQRVLHWKRLSGS
jgi:hypothetical protein